MPLIPQYEYQIYRDAAMHEVHIELWRKWFGRKPRRMAHAIVSDADCLRSKIPSDALYRHHVEFLRSAFVPRIILWQAKRRLRENIK